MKKTNFEELPRFKGSKPELVWLFPKSYPGIAAVMKLKPGEFFPEHYHRESKELYYIISGKGILTLNKKDHPVKEKDAILIEPFERHMIKNVGRRELWVIAVRIPNLPYDSHVDGEDDQKKWISNIDELLQGSE